MDQVAAIEIQALLDVMEGDFLYNYRRICRWYSATFHTPLPMVDDLPMEHVLQTFFENRFEGMTKAQRQKLALKMTETEEEAKKREQKEKRSSDDAFAKRVARKAAKEEKAREAKRKKDDAAAKKHIEQLANQEMVSTPKPPDLPEFSMNFGADGNLISSEDEDCLAPPPRK